VVRKLVYDKPIAVIYNPNSGAKTNIKQKILKAMEARKIEATFFET